MKPYRRLHHLSHSGITSATKKAAWVRISESYNSSCEVPRTELDITKKWDNLVQTHRTKYFDYLRDQGKTGGGPNTKVLSAITEAVMDVIGRFSENVVGVPSCGSNMDSTMVQIERIDQNISSFPLYTEAAAEGSSDNIVTNILNDDPVLDYQVICSKCQCWECIDLRRLKRRKLELEIRKLESPES